MGAGSLRFSNCVILEGLQVSRTHRRLSSHGVFPPAPHSEFTHHRWEAVSGFSFRATPLDPRIQVLHV